MSVVCLIWCLQYSGNVLTLLSLGLVWSGMTWPFWHGHGQMFCYPSLLEMEDLIHAIRLDIACRTSGQPLLPFHLRVDTSISSCSCYCRIGKGSPLMASGCRVSAATTRSQVSSSPLLPPGETVCIARGHCFVLMPSPAVSVCARRCQAKVQPLNVYC
jgi:hypothetical protein